jgi:4-hydroxy-3-polyprenylbenzoate decarboxylase
MIRKPSRFVRASLAMLAEGDRLIHHSLREFLQYLEHRGELKRVNSPVSPAFEITEICRRTIRKAGPALLFENPTEGKMPVVANVYGTGERVAAAIGLNDTKALRELGRQLALLKTPVLPNNLGGAIGKLSQICSPSKPAGRTMPASCLRLVWL